MSEQELNQKFSNIKYYLNSDTGPLIAVADEMISLARNEGLIPRDTGALESSSVVLTKGPKHVQILMPVVYSQRQYYEHKSLNRWWEKVYNLNRTAINNRFVSAIERKTRKE